MLALFPHCQIHTIDFTSSPPPFVEPRIHFYKWGIVGTDDPSRNFYNLPSVVQKLEHMDKEIDVFKMDIEGYELETSGAIFASKEGKKIFRKMRIILIVEVKLLSRCSVSSTPVCYFNITLTP
jgi:hypothetical protein